MGFFRRLFSADYRAAVAAEAAGDLELAAERYALAGQPGAAVRVHLARADRAASRKGEITALRDAHHWSEATEEDEEEIDLRPRVAKRLGRAIMAQANAEGIATERDRERVREAAKFLLDGGDFIAAGEAYESIEDDTSAAGAFRVGGYVDRMEDALYREQSKTDGAREEKSAFADYELASRGGDRDGALRALSRCIRAAGQKTEYRRLFDELEARLIASGRVSLALRNRGQLTVTATARTLMGRDMLCDFVLRSGGISRHHAEVKLEGEAPEPCFLLADAGSKNGTRIGGIRIEGSIPLEGTGSFDLGDHCTVSFTVSIDAPHLTLSVEAGLDRGTTLRAGVAGERIDVRDLDFPATIYFQNDRPMLQHPGGVVRLNGEIIAHGDIQLVHGDQLVLEGMEVEVL